jgi:uncharacterized membrane protein YphA (DoxX/SURF4 family)
MKVALWVVQSLLAVVFLIVGFTKLITPWEDIVAMMPFTATVPEMLVRFIGIAEIAGAIGLILPALTRIKPWLTPVAASCLGVTMAVAAGLHFARHEYGGIGITTLLFALLLFVAWGRFRAVPILERRKKMEHITEGPVPEHAPVY